MPILVVTKPTNYELHGDRVKANMRIGVASAMDMLHRLEQAHTQHKEALANVCGILERYNVSYHLHQRSEPWPSEFAFDLVLTVGGDGTLLYASHQVPENGKIVGIRSSDASVGFTCLAGTEHMDEALPKLLENQVHFVRCSRTRLELIKADGSPSETSVPVLNDILYANCSPAATTRYRIQLGDKAETQKSSGIWISTSVGSTAAILAAGGVEQDLVDRHFQFIARELYRPLGREYDLIGQTFDPDKEELRIENRTENAMVALDGQHGEILLQSGDQIVVKRGPDILLGLPEHKSAH